MELVWVTWQNNRKKAKRTLVKTEREASKYFRSIEIAGEPLPAAADKHFYK